MDLWSRTKDVLVLVEPGTPYGFSIIREAREMVLQLSHKEARRVAKLQALVAEGQAMGILPPNPVPHQQQQQHGECRLRPIANPPDFSLTAISLSLHVAGLVSLPLIPAGADPKRALAIREAVMHPRARQLLSSVPGSHVVAPCPGDGPCPLTGNAAESFCHFKQAGRTLAQPPCPCLCVSAQRQLALARHSQRVALLPRARCRGSSGLS